MSNFTTNPWAGRIALIDITERQVGNTLVVIGDSITENSKELEYGLNIYNSGCSYLHWMQAFLYQRFNLLSNAGVGGNTFLQMSARLETDVIALHPRYCIIAGGANDLSQGFTAVEMIWYLELMIKKLRTAGIIPIVFNPFLIDLSFGVSDNAEWHDFNMWLMIQCNDLGFIYVDIVQNYIDITANYPRPESNTTIDGAHLSCPGGFIIGKTLAEALDPIVPTVPEKRFITNSDANCLNSNPLMTGTGGSLSGATGTTADNWAAFCVNCNTVASKIARDRFGEWQRVDMTASADNGYILIFTDVSGISSEVGVAIEGFAEVKIGAAGLTNPGGIWLSAMFFDASWAETGASITMSHSSGEFSNKTYAANDIFLLKTPVFDVSVNTTIMRLGVYFSAESGGGGIIDIGACGVRRVD